MKRETTSKFFMTRLKELLTPIGAIVGFAAALVTVLLFFHIGPFTLSWPSASAATKGNIKIGVDLPLSNDEGLKGMPVLAGIYLAFQDKAAAFLKGTGYSLSLDIRDYVNSQTGQYDSATGVSTIRSLLSDHVAGIIGPYNTDVAISEIPIAAASNTTLISPSTTGDCLTNYSSLTTPQDTACNKALGSLNSSSTFFHMTALNTEQASVLTKCLAQQIATSMQLCRTSRKYQRVAIFEDESTYGSELAAQLAKQWGGNALSFGNMQYAAVGGSITEMQLETLQNNSSADNPLLVFYAGTKGIQSIYTAISQHVPFAAFASSDDSPDFTAYLKTHMSSQHPVYAVSPIRSIDQGNTAEQTGVIAFTHAYRDGFSNHEPLIQGLATTLKANNIFPSLDRLRATIGDSPIPYGAAGFDATEILIQAISKTIGQQVPIGNTSDFSASVVSNVRGGQPPNPSAYVYPGVTGTYTGFKSNGDVDESYAPVAIYQYQDPADGFRSM